ncbi:MAG: cytochrome C [Flavobacteriaceae bacterium]|nr:MAG: cytochrome C [Flavobacteriaceae bacterium]
MKLKLILVALVIAVSSCGGNDKKEVKKEAPVKEVVKEVVKTNPMDDKGVGPITSVTIGALDQALADKGHVLFKAKCSACHKINKRYIGPALRGVTKKQSPEWIMNMILNPEVMIVQNAKAKALLAEYNAPMANQNLTQDEARAILEYFRTKN